MAVSLRYNKKLLDKRQTDFINLVLQIYKTGRISTVTNAPYLSKFTHRFNTILGQGYYYTDKASGYPRGPYSTDQDALNKVGKQYKEIYGNQKNTK